MGDAVTGAAEVDVVVVDHHDSYTWNLVHLVAGVTGELPDVLEHDQPGVLEAAGGYTHIVLSPGPGHPANLADFALGRAVFELDVPVLGVCLGMQALVTAYGGKVGRVPPALRVTAVAGPVVMGVAHRELPLHGVQFHPESILSEHGAHLVRNFLGLA